MKLRVGGIALIAAATITLGLSGCSGSEAPAETTAATVVETTQAPTMETTSEAAGSADQNVLKACADLAEPLADAGSEMAETMQSAVNDPQAAVQVWTDITDTYQQLADKTTNADVKSALADLIRDTGAARDAFKKAYVDGDMSAVSEIETASTAMSNSLDKLSDICNP